MPRPKGSRNYNHSDGNGDARGFKAVSLTIPLPFYEALKEKAGKEHSIGHILRYSTAVQLDLPTTPNFIGHDKVHRKYEGLSEAERKQIAADRNKAKSDVATAMAAAVHEAGQNLERKRALEAMLSEFGLSFTDVEKLAK